MAYQPTVELDRMAPSRRPPGNAIGYQRWTELAFVHWRLEASVIRRLLPAELELDLWDGDAWIGLVPFHMSEVRPRWFCAVPGVSEFHETNVRTYVVHQGMPGVWFFSLEAANRLAVEIGRRRWNLNYFHARMHLESSGNRRSYRSRRFAAGPPAACDLTLTLDDPSAICSPARPGTLEHFLVERYYLYTATRRGRLLRGQVHHEPYSIRGAKLEHIDETLLAAAGIQPKAPPCHVLYSPGVRVEVFPLRPVG